MHPGKILLLSDGSQIFPVLNRFFASEGYETVTASSSRGAMQAMRQGDFRLVIARMNEAGRGGLRFLQALRRERPGIAAIILKGEHEVNSPLEAYQVQGNEEIFIPCGWPGLRRLVATCVKG